MTASHFDLFIQTPRVIIERHRSRLRYSFAFLVSFLPSTLTAYLRSQSNEFGHYHTIIFVLHQAGYFFVRERHTVYVVCQIIARVESSDIAQFLYSRKHRRILYVNETVRDLTFIAIHRCIRDEIRTSRLLICRVCTYPRKSACRTSPRVYSIFHFNQIFRKDTAAVKIRDHCLLSTRRLT